MTDELLTASEVADLLRVPLGTLYMWRSLGRDKNGLPLGPDSFKVGARVLYERSEVERWLAAQRETTSAHRRAS